MALTSDWDRPTSFRVRRTALSMTDRLTYGELLHEAFPNVRFMDDPGSYPKGADFDVRPGESLKTCRRRNVLITFDPTWKPRWRQSEKTKVWTKGRIPYPNADFDDSGQICRWQDADVESLVGGQLCFRMTPGDEEHARIVGKALRLFEKIASNKNLAWLRLPSMEPISENPIGASPWVGHDARRWCAEKPNRALYAGPLSRDGFRPISEESARPAAKRRKARPRKEKTVEAPPEWDRPTSVRARRTALSKTDRLTFGRLLREAFPNIRFIDDPGIHPKGADFDILPRESLEECRRSNVLIVFDPEWKPQWRQDERSKGWIKGFVPYPCATFDDGGRTCRRTDADIESLIGGTLTFRITPGDKKHERLVAKAFRLLTQVASKERLSWIRVPLMHSLIENDTGARLWVGHDARRWCLEKPNRVLSAGPSDVAAYRPIP